MIGSKPGPACFLGSPRRFELKSSVPHELDSMICRNKRQKMVAHDCGSIPIVENKETKKLVGIITDRDRSIKLKTRIESNERSFSFFFNHFLFDLFHLFHSHLSELFLLVWSQNIIQFCISTIMNGFHLLV